MAKLTADKFDVATALLGGQGLWSNLGDWSVARSYDEAAIALARRVGKVAELGPGQQVLDVACGYGGSVRLWLDEFRVKAVDAIEIRPDCIESLRQSGIPGLRHSVIGNVSHLLDKPSSPRYNAVVSVDAAYHFADALTLAHLAQRSLANGGKLAYTTLVRADAGGGVKRSVAERVFMKAAGIPDAAVPTSSGLTIGLTALGFSRIAIEPLTNEVCLGFASFVDKVAVKLTSSEKLSPAWWKIALTAKACRYLESWGLSYALITCQF